MTSKDKRFPVLFIVVALVLTFGVFVIDSLRMSITGAAISNAGILVSAVLALPSLLLIVLALVVGIFALRYVK